MRILIVEEALRLGNGHWPRYVQDLAAGFRSAGDVVDVLGHRQASEKVTTVVEGVVPWLSRDCRSDRRSQGLLGGIRHNLCLYRELSVWLDGQEPYDWILSLSSRPKHLLAFALLAGKRRWRKSRFLLLFVLGAGQRGGTGKFRSSPSNIFARLCFAWLKPAVRRGQVVLAAETEGMQRELTEFSGQRVVLFPHPVEAAEPREDGWLRQGGKVGKWEGGRKSEVGGQTSEIRNQRAEHVGRKSDVGGQNRAERDRLERSDSRAAGSPGGEIKSEISDQRSGGGGQKVVTVVAPGLARYEKGSDILQEAIAILRKDEKFSGDAVKFVLQWPEPFDLPDGRQCVPDPDLMAGGNVEFNTELLTGSDYIDFLDRADLVVLPYRRASYHSRVSRVAIEAAQLRKPLVYTHGTWTSEVAERSGAGVDVSEETPEALAEGIRNAIGRLPSLLAAAQQGAVSVREFYTVSEFRRLLHDGALDMM